MTVKVKKYIISLLIYYKHVCWGRLPELIVDIIINSKRGKEMNRNKLFQKLYSVIMAVILLAQLLTPIAQIDANDQVSTNADTVKLIDAKQDDNQQGTLALKIHTKNTGSTTTQAKVKATSNEGLVLKNTDKETTLTDTIIRKLANILSKIISWT